MDLRKYQERVLAGSVCVDDDRRFVENTLGLTGESAEFMETVFLVRASGRFADLVKKEIRDGAGHRPRQIEELGDVLWYLTSLAGQLGLTLDELASYNYEKLHYRWPQSYPAVFE